MLVCLFTNNGQVAVGSLVYKHVASACRLACLQTGEQVHVGSFVYKHVGRCMLALLFTNTWAGACWLACLQTRGQMHVRSLTCGI